MKTILSFLLVLVILTGCSPNVQVVTLRGSNVRPAEKGLVFDNDSLTLSYNFASERGLMQLTLLNKLNKPLYIDWKRSSFIVGQDKIDYWYDVADVTLMGSLYSYDRYYSTTYAGGTISKADRVSFIPPQTRLEKAQFVLVPNGSVAASGPFTVVQEPSKLMNTKKPVDVHVYTYTPDRSPLTFRNYLTLSTDKDFKTEFVVDTKFWASDVKVLPRDQILTQVSEGEHMYSTPIPFKQSDSFYVPLAAQ